MIDHIEKNRCRRIKNDDYAAAREDKLAFARELQRRHRGEQPGLPDDLSVARLSLAETTGPEHGSYNFTPYISTVRDKLPGTPGLSDFHPKEGNMVQPKPITFVAKEADFPRLGGKLPDLLTGGTVGKAEKQAGNPWAQKKNLFADAPTPVRPTPEKREATPKPTQPEETAWPPHDPRHPQWDPSDYYVTYINKYKCPHDRCP